MEKNEPTKTKTAGADVAPAPGGGVVLGLTAAQQVALASTTAPAVRGMLDQLKEVRAIENGENTASMQSHTFGAWCRAKGISAQELARLVREDNVKLPDGAGDGPTMSEREFDQAVNFKYRLAFGGTAEAVKVAGYADAEAQRAAEADAKEALRKV